MDPWNVCLYVCMYVCMYVYIYIYIYMCECMYELEYLTFHNRAHWILSIPHILTIRLLGN